MGRYVRLLTTSTCIIAVIIGIVLVHELPFDFLYSKESSSSITTLFPPDDQPLDYLKPLVDQEYSRIYVAAYRLTDNDVATSLMQAQKRGVPVEVVADASALEARYNKVLEMLTNGIDVYVFPPFSSQDTEDDARFSKSALMHNKFMLFESNSTVWTGSFNFTVAARTSHQENVVIMRDRKQFFRYRDHFNVLKRRSTALARVFQRAVKKT